MILRDYLRSRWQRWKGCPPHLWFPVSEQRQYIPVNVTCLRCTSQRVFLPSGSCLGGDHHPIRDHYDEKGNPVFVPSCPEGPL